MSLAKNAGRMSIAVFLSRILGLVREQVFAALFGAGVAADAYQVAFRIPNLLRDLFAEGAFSPAFVTVFSKARSPEEQRRLASVIMTALTVLVGIACAGIFLAAPAIVDLMTDQNFQSDPLRRDLAVSLTRLFSPFLYFVSSAAIAMGVLNSLGHFFMPAMGAAAFNLGNIVIGGGLAWMAADRGVSAAAWGFGLGTLAGAALQWLVQWPSLKREGFTPWAGLSRVFSLARVREAFGDEGFRAVLRLMAPAVLSLATVPIMSFVSTNYATAAGPGAIAWITYAYRLIHFPMGVFGVALSTAAMPKLASLVRDGKTREFGETLEQAFGLGFILALGSAAGLFVFRLPLVSLIYQHGRFMPADTVRVGEALSAYALGLVAFTCTKIFVQAFYALDRVWVPSVVSFASIGLNVALNASFVRHFGHAGVPLSMSITSLSVMLFLMIFLRAKGVPFVTAKTLRVVAASAVGSLAMVALDYRFGFTDQILRVREAHGFAPFAGAVLGGVAVGGAFYLGVVTLLTPEGRVLAQRLGGRFFKRR